MKCNDTYLKMELVYSSDVVTGMVDSALWSASCKIHTPMYIASV